MNMASTSDLSLTMTTVNPRWLTVFVWPQAKQTPAIILSPLGDERGELTLIFKSSGAIGLSENQRFIRLVTIQLMENL